MARDWRNNYSDSTATIESWGALFERKITVPGSGPVQTLQIVLGIGPSKFCRIDLFPLQLWLVHKNLPSAFGREDLPDEPELVLRKLFVFAGRCDALRRLKGVKPADPPYLGKISSLGINLEKKVPDDAFRRPLTKLPPYFDKFSSAPRSLCICDSGQRWRRRLTNNKPSRAPSDIYGAMVHLLSLIPSHGDDPYLYGPVFPRAHQAPSLVSPSLPLIRRSGGLFSPPPPVSTPPLSPR
jgi:hypothetical protein